MHIFYVIILTAILWVLGVPTWLVWLPLGLILVIVVIGIATFATNREIKRIYKQHDEMF